jgi:hypothetical protein
MLDLCRDLSDVAEGGDGAKSEAAAHFSPRLQPWTIRKDRPERATEGLFRLQAGSVSARKPSNSGTLKTVAAVAFGRPFRAHHRGLPYPGLKPWAILFSHFVGIADTPLLPLVRITWFINPVGGIHDIFGRTPQLDESVG